MVDDRWSIIDGGILLHSTPHNRLEPANRIDKLSGVMSLTVQCFQVKTQVSLSPHCCQTKNVRALARLRR